MVNSIEKAVRAIEKNKKKALQCPQRPQYHLIAPSGWMNDPNGPVFFNGIYHIFYQHNPYNPTWGQIHWGHASSSDLVHWNHHPPALVPSKKEGEHHCFSGCCTIVKGIPTIIYTSIGHVWQVPFYAEQWVAISEDGLDTWQKIPENPVMTPTIHGSLPVRDWRDPYVWQEQQEWFAVLGGHIHDQSAGATFLYHSEDCRKWTFLGPLYSAPTSLIDNVGHNWECPNFFQMGDRWVLLVSPQGGPNRTLYSIGTYVNHQFNPGPWYIFDYGQPFYAPNTLRDPTWRMLLFGWIRSKGIAWNGCISFPRELSIDPTIPDRLQIRPIQELQKLRKNHASHESQALLSNSNLKITIPASQTYEILVELDMTETGNVELNVENRWKIELNLVQKMILANNQQIPLEQREIDHHPTSFHFLIDRSIIELFINNRLCITDQALLSTQSSENYYFKISNQGEGQINVQKLEMWNLQLDL